MSTISGTFNNQAQTDINIIPLWILLILLPCEAKERKRQKRLDRQQRQNFKGEMKRSEQQYQRQIGLAAPRF